MKNFNLNELNLENAGQWPTPIKYAAALILALLIIAVAYWFIIKSHFEHYDNLKTQEVELKSQFELKQQQAANLMPYRLQLEAIKARFGKILMQLPAKNEMPGLLEDISKTGVGSGLTFNLFAPQPEVTHEFYIEVPINIKVVGNYHQLAVFISRIAQMDRIVTLHDIEINTITPDKTKMNTAAPTAPNTTPNTTPAPNTGNLLEMTMTAKIYRYKTL